MIKTISTLIVVISLGGVLNIAAAGSLSIPNTFTSGTKAVAADVNGDFTAVKTALDDNDSRITTNDSHITTNDNHITTNDSRITALEKSIATLKTSLTTANTTIVTLQASLKKVSGNTVLDLDKSLVYTTDVNGYPTAQFTGINVQVVNGTGQETDVNGLGNLIVGYNHPRPSGISNVCSDGQYTTQATCEGAGDTWAISFKSGSHNLVVGDYNSYSRYGGVVFGDQNVISGVYAVVSGGAGNIASGQSSVVSGGDGNTASGYASSVSGGVSNKASGGSSSVSGGSNKTAATTSSWVAGSYHTP